MKIKLGLSLLLAFLAFVFITQNTEPVMVDFMAWSIEMSVALLVFIMLGAGIVIGWMLSSYSRYSRNRKRGKAQSTKVEKQEETVIPVQGEQETDEQQN